MGSNEMTNVRICWYLCGLFAASLVISSAITVHPDSQNTMVLVSSVGTAASVVFGTLAFVGGRTALLQARWVTVTLRCVAVLATLVVFLFGFG